MSTRADSQKSCLPLPRSRRRWSKEFEADQGSGSVEKSLEQIGSSLVADVKAAKSEAPGKRALHDTAVPTEALGGVDPTAGDPRDDGVQHRDQLPGHRLRRHVAGGQRATPSLS